MLKEKELIKTDILTLVKILLGFVFGIMLFPGILKSIVIMLFSISILFLSYTRGFKINKQMFFINSSIYIGILITLIYTSNYSEASNKLQTMLSLVVFSLMFSLLTKNEIVSIFKNIKTYLCIYIISTCLYNVMPFLWLYITHYTLEDVIRHYPLIIIKDIGGYSIHPIYMSMHCVVSIFFSIYIFKNLNSRMLKIVILLLNIILLFFLTIYARKGPILALLPILFFWSLFNERKKRKHYLLALIGFSILMISIPKTRNRLVELVKIEEATSIGSNSTNTRVSIYKNAFLLIKQSPFFGYGIGDYNNQLRLSYKKNAPYLLSKQYNSHNQYLSFLLIGGIPLLLIFLCMIYYNLNLSFNNNNTLSIIVIGFYCLVMLSENILERENGVIFFSFFLNFFSLKNYIKSEE
jgi:O-antigen ligase